MLNDICKSHYSNSALGVKARSIKIEDLEKQYSELALEKRDNYVSEDRNWDEVKYGETKLYESGYDWYPTLYEQEIKSGINGTIRGDGIGLSNSFYTNNESLSRAYDESGNKIDTSKKQTTNGKLNITQTHYSFAMESSYFKNITFYNMIIVDYYWLASRCVGVAYNVNGASFGIRYVAANRSISNHSVFGSDGKEISSSISGVRPVVTIPADIYVVTNEQRNSKTNMWMLN